MLWRCIEIDRDNGNMTQKFLDLDGLSPVNAVTIDISKDETITLRHMDFGALSDGLKLYDEDISAREFTVRLLHPYLIEPEISLDSMSKWKDNVILHVASEWYTKTSGFKDSDEISLTTFEDFRSLLANQAKKTAEHLRGAMASPFHNRGAIYEALAQNMFGPINVVNTSLLEARRLLVDTAQQTTNAYVQALVNQPSALSQLERSITSVSSCLRNSIGTTISNLQSLQSILDNSRKASQGADALKEHDYGFAIDFCTTAFFMNVANENPSCRQEFISEQILSATTSPEFEAAMKDKLGSAPALGKRWPIIESGLCAHTSGQHNLSVPLFLAQIEGLLTDALIAVGAAKRPIQGGAVLSVDNPKEKIIGLHNKATLYRTRCGESRYFSDSLVDYLADSLTPSRNSIMHGESLDYGTSETSAKAALALFSVVCMACNIIQDQANTNTASQAIAAENPVQHMSD